MSSEKPDGCPFYCSDLKEVGGDFSCCSSCHEDWEDYDYCLSEPQRDELEFRLCCEACEVVEDCNPEEWKVLKAKLLALRNQNNKTKEVE